MEMDSNEQQQEQKSTLTKTEEEEASSKDAQTTVEESEPELLPLQCPHAMINKGKVTCSLINVRIPHKQSNACQSILYRLCLIYITFDKNLELYSHESKGNVATMACKHLSQSGSRDTPQYFCQLDNRVLKVEVANQFCKKPHHVECFLLK